MTMHTVDAMTISRILLLIHMLSAVLHAFQKPQIYDDSARHAPSVHGAATVCIFNPLLQPDGCMTTSGS